MLSQRQFTVYGPSHWVAISVFVVGAALLVWWLTRLLVLPREQATWRLLLQSQPDPQPQHQRPHPGLPAAATQASAP